MGTVNDEDIVWMAEESWLDSWQGPGIFLFSTLSSPALGLVHPPIQRVLEAVFHRGGNQDMKLDVCHYSPCTGKRLPVYRLSCIFLSFITWYFV